MKVFGLFLLLFVAVVVFGSIAFFGYKLFLAPAKEMRAEQAAAAVEPAPTPDPALPEFEEAMELANDRTKIFDAIAKLQSFVARHARSPLFGEAKAILGELNATVVFTTMDAPDKVEYTVQRGDSLVRVASRTNSNAELIMRSNNMPSIDLQIGQVLKVPQLDTAIVIDRPTQTLTVFNNNVFFKEYPLLSPVSGSSEVDTTVREKIAQRDGRRITFGGRDFPGSERIIQLADGGLSIRGVDPAVGGTGIVVSQHDIEEIFPLVTRGTRVIIR